MENSKNSTSDGRMCVADAARLCIFHLLVRNAAVCEENYPFGDECRAVHKSFYK